MSGDLRAMCPFGGLLSLNGLRPFGLMFVGAGSITAWYGDIQQTQENTQLCAVMNDLAIGHSYDLSFCGLLKDLFAITECPGFLEDIFGGHFKMHSSVCQGPIEIFQ